MAGTVQTDDEQETDDPTAALPGDPDLGPEPAEVAQMTVHPLARQNIQGQIDIKTDVIGIVTDGFDKYRVRRCVGHRSIPSTYGEWDEEFPDATNGYGRYEVDVIDGPKGVAEDDEGGLHLQYQSQLVQACVRLFTGGGVPFSAEKFTLHLAVPLAVLEYDGGGAIAIAPTEEGLDEPPEDPDFSYRGGTNPETITYSVPPKQE